MRKILNANELQVGPAMTSFSPWHYIDVCVLPEITNKTKFGQVHVCPDCGSMFGVFARRREDADSDRTKESRYRKEWRKILNHQAMEFAESGWRDPVVLDQPPVREPLPTRPSVILATLQYSDHEEEGNVRLCGPDQDGDWWDLNPSRWVRPEDITQFTVLWSDPR